MTLRPLGEVTIVDPRDGAYCIRYLVSAPCAPSTVFYVFPPWPKRCGARLGPLGRGDRELTFFA